MAGGVHVRVGLQNDAVRTDQVADALRVLGVGALAGAVGDAGRAGRVAEKRKVEAELLREGLVLLRGVEADAQDLGILLLVAGDLVAEPATFLRSPGGVGLRIKPEHDVLSREVGETDRRAVVRRKLEQRSCLTFFQHLLMTLDS